MIPLPVWTLSSSSSSFLPLTEKENPPFVSTNWLGEFPISPFLSLSSSTSFRLPHLRGGGKAKKKWEGEEEKTFCHVSSFS